MNNKVIKLIDQCKQYTPLDGRVIVYALKIKQVKQEAYGLEPADTKSNEGKDPKIHRIDLKKVRPMINAKYQEAVVLQIPDDENRFKIGDTVIYHIGAVNSFDIVKGASMLRKYDIAAVINALPETAKLDEQVNDVEGYATN